MNSRTIAFLRAINVGGRTVKMDQLRVLFSSLGLSNVETFIASGNVIFDSVDDDGELAQNIEKHLRENLGFEVATFLRSQDQVKAIAGLEPFPFSQMKTAVALNVAFISAPLDAVSEQKLMSLRTEIDDFRVYGCEVYWLCLKKQSESKFSNAVLEKTLGVSSTLRGMGTLQKLSAKLDT